MGLNECHDFPLVPFSSIDNISVWVNNSNFTLAFFKAAYQANIGVERNFAGSNS